MNRSTQTQYETSPTSDTIRNHPSRRIYRIRVDGRLDDTWTEWFDGLLITHEDDKTVLSGSVIDQSALHGILRKLHDLGLELVEVKRVDDVMM